MTDEGPRFDPFATSPPRTNPSAIWSVVLSILGFACLVGLGGLLGVALGLMARSEIDRSEGRLTGKGLANTGIALGTLNVVACIAGIAALATYIARPSPPPPSYATPGYAPTATSPAPAPGPAKPPTLATAGGKLSPGAASREDGVVETRIGSLVLADIGPAVPSLRNALDAERASAEKDGKKLLLWVVTQDCKPCNGVAASLPDPGMQTALAGVRLVRLDARDFVLELQRLHVPIAKYPGFALLGSDDRPIDYVHGGEWDADVPANIAPVLGKFVRGTYTTRRDPWHGGNRDDETPL